MEKVLKMNNEDKLIEWTIRYVKHKDLFSKKLIDYKILKNFIEFKFKHKEHVYYIYDELSSQVLDLLKDSWITFIVLNKQKNVQFLLDNWKNFSKFEKLNIYFVNPNTNQNWIIYPNTHEKITSEKSLKPGLMTLYNSIQTIG